VGRPKNPKGGIWGGEKGRWETQGHSTQGRQGMPRWNSKPKGRNKEGSDWDGERSKGVYNTAMPNSCAKETHRTTMLHPCQRI